MTEPGQFIDANTVRFERLFPGPAERVWDYLTKPDRLTAWLADGDFEARPGGRVELRFEVDEAPEHQQGSAVIGGFITRWDPPRHLAYSWTDKSPQTRASAVAAHVAFELEPQADDVSPKLTHDRLPPALLARCAAGWHAHLEILRARLRWETPPGFLLIFEQVLPLYRQRVGEKVDELKSRSS